jgi:hypothetical protein
MKKGRVGTMIHDYKRHDQSVCGAEYPRRHHYRPQYAAPPAPGVHPLPQHHRGPGAGTKAIHAIIDNYANRKHPKVQEWLARHPAGRSASHQPRHHGSTLSKASSQSLRDAASNAACSDPWMISKPPSIASLPKPTPI